MSEYEQWVLSGTALNDATFTLESITDTPAAKKPEWVSGADSDGEILGRPPKYANKVIEMRLRVAKQASMDLALAKVAQILDLLQECEQNANGLALVWTPADATTSAITWRALLGEITDLPKDWQDSGWFVRSPAFTIRLTCLPVGRGVEYLAGTVTSSAPIHVVTITDVPGDGPFEGRLVFTEAASQSRRWVCWGAEHRWLPTSGAPSLILDSTSMVTSGHAGTTATRSGAYSGASNNVISATLRPQVQAICGLGNLSHVGSFRPQLRFYASATTMAVRLTYQTLDGPFRSLSYRVPVAVGWNHVDLGLVSIPSASLGTQRWTGRIEAMSTATGGETFQADAVWIVPAELFGRARASYSYNAGPVVAYDDFTGMVSTTALNAAVSDSGATWATSGSASDFVASDDPAAETVVRTTTSDTWSGRHAVLGSTNYTDVEVATRLYTVNVGSRQAVGARWVDADNRVEAIFQAGDPNPGGATFWVSMSTTAGGTVELTPITIVSAALSTWYRTRLVVFASGRGFAELTNDNGALIIRHAFYSASLATAGTLATGKPFLRDQYFGPAAGTQGRYYDTFTVGTPGAEPIAVYAGQSIEFRHNTTLREDATGTYAGPPPEYVGSRFYGQPAGGPDRQTRVAVMAKRNDVEVAADEHIADSGTVDVYVTPGYTAVPR